MLLQCVESGPQYISIVMRVLVAILLLFSNCNRMHVLSVLYILCSTYLSMHLKQSHQNSLLTFYFYYFYFVIVPQRHVKLSPKHLLPVSGDCPPAKLLNGSPN